jgi:glycosyltransferase involved in cell wall biosynthesis
MATAPFISIVLPTHNESQVLRRTVEEVEQHTAQCSDHYELIFIDDGSSDDTFEVTSALAKANTHVIGLQLSRNFGKEAALLAGLKHAAGDVVITMDADLQHPPAVIPALVDAWQQGYKVVNAVKEDRPGDSFAVKLRARLFNKLLTSLGGVDMRGASDFKLLDRSVVDILSRSLPERSRFFRGLSDWVGFPQTSVPFTVASRAEGTGKWSIFALTELALTALVAFTSAPLRIVSILGVVTLIFGGIVAGEALWSWFHGKAISGFTTTITTILILSSFIMISLGIIGEYIAKIYDEIKHRPVYLVASVCGSQDTRAPSASPNVRKPEQAMGSFGKGPDAVGGEVPDQHE